jgi:hypothetical protein
MSEEKATEAPPAMTQADKLAATIAKHAHAARVAGGEAETARRYVATEAFATVVHEELKPALKAIMEPVIAAMPDDHPLKLLVGLAGSPGNVVLDALLDIILFPLAFYGALRQVPQILAENIINDVNAKHPNIPLSPALVANLIQTSYQPPENLWHDQFDTGQEAAYSGINAARLDAMTYLSGNAPSPQDLFELYRRGALPYTGTETGQLSVIEGLLQGDTKNTWVDMLAKLSHVWPSPADFVNAAERGQLPYQTAKAWASAVGLDLTVDTSNPPAPQPYGEVQGIDNPRSFFEALFDIAGRPPGPEEASRMAWRGIIPWGETAPAGYTAPAEGTLSEKAGHPATGPTGISFAQSIAESDVKTKWTPWLAALSEYVPPPRMVGGLLEKGGITEDQARTFWAAGGVPTTLVDAYVYEATQEATIKEKDLAKGETLSAYYDLIINRTDAEEMLGLLGYKGKVAAYMLDVSDFRRELKALNAEVNRVGGYYMHHKVSEVEAQSMLETLGVPTDQIAGLLSVWSVDRIAPIRLPSTDQISKAVKYGTLTQDDALRKLEVLGYTAEDAAIILSAEAEIKITPLPAQSGNPPPVV